MPAGGDGGWGSTSESRRNGTRAGMEYTPHDKSGPPAVSVVVPTYNQPALLLETLASVFAQTFTDFEVVVVDDGSTDDTLARLRPLEEQHPGRLRIVTQANAGVGAARNRGIDEARGKYVALLDHDDLWMPGKLAAQVRFLELHPDACGVVVPYAVSTAPGRPVFDPAAVAAADGVISRPFRKLADKVPILTTCSVLMFPADKARGLRFGTVRGAIEDVPFQIGLLARGPLGVAGEGVQAIYRLHAANTFRQSSYFYEGHKLLRRLDREGAFAAVRGPDRADLLAWLAFIGRATATTQLGLGLRRRGLGVYVRELAHQVRDGRLDFVAAYPVLALAPRRVVTWWMNRKPG